MALERLQFYCTTFARSKFWLGSLRFTSYAMSSISWVTLKSLLIFFAPMLLPKAIAYYRSVRAAPSTEGVSIRPIPPKVFRALLIIAIISLSFLLKALSVFSPENIFYLTSSRLQIPTDVLFTRLSALRPTGLTLQDEILRSKIVSMDARLYYFQYGPDVLTNCMWCNAEDPDSYFYYALPALLTPHLFNICILALVTSGLFAGTEGAKWRTTGAVAGGILAAWDTYLVNSYPAQGNSRATRLENIDPFFWRMRVYRSFALALLDGAIGWLLYLSSTNRAFISQPSTAERLETSTRIIDDTRRKMNAVSILRNTITRSEELRSRSQGYWIHEGRFMGELMEEREVVEGVRNALNSRIDMQTITKDAEAYAQGVVGPLQGVGADGSM